MAVLTSNGCTTTSSGEERRERVVGVAEVKAVEPRRKVSSEEVSWAFLASRRRRSSMTGRGGGLRYGC